MNAAQLKELIDRPAAMRANHLHTLDNLAQRYPYFQVLRMLLARGKYTLRKSDAKRNINLALLYATDRRRFRSFMEAAKRSIQPSYPGTHRSLSTSSFQPEFTPPTTAPSSLPPLQIPDTMSDSERDNLVNEINYQLDDLKRNMRHYEETIRDYEDRFKKKL